MEIESTHGTPSTGARLLQYMFSDPTEAGPVYTHTFRTPVEHAVRLAGSDFPPYLVCDCGWVDYPDTDSVSELAGIAAAHVEAGVAPSFTVTEMVPTSEGSITYDTDWPEFEVGQVVMVDVGAGRMEMKVAEVEPSEDGGMRFYMVSTEMSLVSRTERSLTVQTPVAPSEFEHTGERLDRFNLDSGPTTPAP